MHSGSEPLFPLKQYALWLVTAVAVLSTVMLLCDALITARAAIRRRRKRRGGVVGVVVDRAGATLGTYLDPFGHLPRAPRMHGADSPWTSPGPEGRPGWAWEGFGATEEEARRAANRLRRRHLQLLPWLSEVDEGGEGDVLPFRVPTAPPSL